MFSGRGLLFNRFRIKKMVRRTIAIMSIHRAKFGTVSVFTNVTADIEAVFTSISALSSSPRKTLGLVAAKASFERTYSVCIAFSRALAMTSIRSCGVPLGNHQKFRIAKVASIPSSRAVGIFGISGSRDLLNTARALIPAGS